MRLVVFSLSVCGLMCMASSSASIESVYQEQIASLATGVHDAGCSVYFHVRLAREASVAEEIYRRKAMLAVQRQLLDWVKVHATTSPQLPEDVRRMEELTEQFDRALPRQDITVSVPGRVFVQDDGGWYAYAFVADKKLLLKEADKGVPGRTEHDIRFRWKQVCQLELARKAPVNGFWEAIGCGDPLRVPDSVAKAVSIECQFLEGWPADSDVLKALKTPGRPSVESEDVWMEGLSLITDLNRGVISVQDAGPRFYKALSETPGSPVLWSHLGNYFVKLELYNLAAVAYKNALCLSGSMNLGTLLASFCDNLSLTYQALRETDKGRGYRILSQGLN